MLGPHANFHQKIMGHFRELEFFPHCLITAAFFFWGDAKEPYPTSQMILALHKQHDHLGVTTASIWLVVFNLIAAAPRPLRLRRGFVVSTAPLIRMGADFTLIDYVV